MSYGVGLFKCEGKAYSCLAFELGRLVDLALPVLLLLLLLVSIVLFVVFDGLCRCVDDESIRSDPGNNHGGIALNPGVGWLALLAALYRACGVAVDDTDAARHLAPAVRLDEATALPVTNADDDDPGANDMAAPAF